MIGDVQLAIPPSRWGDAIHKIRTEGSANYALYAAIDFCLTVEAKLQHRPYFYPALADALHEELCQHGPRKARR